jgi:hypothetical protein
MDFKTPYDSPQWLYEQHQDRICNILSRVEGRISSTILEEWIVQVTAILCGNRDIGFITDFMKILVQEINAVLREQIFVPGSEVTGNRSEPDDSKDRNVPEPRHSEYSNPEHRTRPRLRIRRRPESSNHAVTGTSSLDGGVPRNNVDPSTITTTS